VAELEDVEPDAGVSAFLAGAEVSVVVGAAADVSGLLSAGLTIPLPSFFWLQDNQSHGNRLNKNLNP